MSFEIIPGDPHSSVVLHVPHSSVHIPEDVRAGIVLYDEALAGELAAMTDADTDSIALGAADLCTVRPWIFVNRASRLVIDPERFPDEREELNAVGMGAVYERTSDGSVLREPTAEQRQDLIDRFFTPYAESLSELVDQRLQAVGEVTIIDVHSYPVEPNPYELHTDGPRPELCIGVDDFHTPSSLAVAVDQAFTAVAATRDHNSPFIGTYVPMKHYGVTRAVSSAMLEIRRDKVATDLDGLAAATADLVDGVELVGLCRRLAVAAHGGQKDKLGRGYADAHLAPIAVGCALFGAEFEAAGWLHDVIEDTDHTSSSLIDAGVPEAVAAAVESVSKRSGEPYEALIARAVEHPIGRIVKLVDNAWNIANNPLLHDRAQADDLMQRKYLPAREALLAHVTESQRSTLAEVDEMWRRSGWV